HRQIGPGGGQSGGDGGCAAVDGVHPVGVHVVREAGRAADAGDEDDVLAFQAQGGQERLDGVEHDVVAAARAPPHFLVGLVVLGLLLFVGRGYEVESAQLRQTQVDLGHLTTTSLSVGETFVAMSVNTCSSSSALNGKPAILVWEWMSTRYFARNSHASWPVFISGTTTLS